MVRVVGETRMASLFPSFKKTKLEASQFLVSDRQSIAKKEEAGGFVDR